MRAQIRAKETGFCLSPIKSHWRLALYVYIFWTIQLIILARVLQHPLQQLHFGACMCVCMCAFACLLARVRVRVHVRVWVCMCV